MRGLVQIYTGNGKGKTSMAFGASLRAIGRGLRVCIIQFLKGERSGEIIALEKFSPDNVVVYQFGRPEFIKDGGTKEDRVLAREALVMATDMISDGLFDMIILDEINVALSMNLIRMKDVEKLLFIHRLSTKPIELIFTGRNAPQAIIDYADLVSKIEDVKHPYEEGKIGRVGIDL